MSLRLMNARCYNPGDKTIVEKERLIKELSFNVHKFTSRTIPNDPKKKMYFSSFSEFGSETITSLYAIPRLAQAFPGMYRIAMGWRGREYLYRNIVDEFWELKEDYMWLREYSLSFHHYSRNLANLEKGIKNKAGVLVDSRALARQVHLTLCYDCHFQWKDSTGSEFCSKCQSSNLRKSLYGNITDCKKEVCLPPVPSVQKMNFAKRLLGKRPVGVFARGRKCYGRNLNPDFYQNLLNVLKTMGYDPIWLGEPSTSLQCPDNEIVDFTKMPECRDMEVTTAIVKQCNFTIQFWTASTRLSGFFGTPFLLVESPSQLWDGSNYQMPGQEGYRLELCSFGPRKVIASNFESFVGNQELGLKIIEDAIKEIEQNNYETRIGIVEDELAVRKLWEEFNIRTRLEF